MNGSCLAFNYMTQFKCLGSACDDTCCSGWTIPIDEENYHDLEKTMKPSKAENEKFLEAIELQPEAERKPSFYASLRMREDEFCPFLSEDKLCYIHSRYGVSLLNHTCTVYPRKFRLVGDEMELTGMLSCPEIARRCLLKKEATERVAFKPPFLPRPHLIQRLVKESEDPYVRYFPEIRSVMLQLLSISEYPLVTRLFFMTYFAHRINDFFFSGSKQFTEARLIEEIDRLGQPEFMEGWHERLQEIELPGPLGMTITGTVLLGRLQVPGNPRFFRLVKDILSTYQSQAASCRSFGKDEYQVKLSANELWQAYSERKKRIETASGEKIDQYFKNYCDNYWVTEWYINSPTLLIHMQNLLARIALLRFLLYSHPGLPDVSDDISEPGQKQSEAVLDDLAVEIFYMVSREIEHVPVFLKKIQESLEEEQMQTFAHLVFLLKF